MDDKTVAQLLNPQVFNHPTKDFKILETHISWVILTGDFAYKIKKSVTFEFVDFSSLEKRLYYCHEELRLNQILCPNLYINVCPIVKKDNHFYINCNHDNDNSDDDNYIVIDYAIKMKQFDQNTLLNHSLQNNVKDINEQYDLMDDLAQQLAKFHSLTDLAPKERSFGDLASILEPLQANFETIASIKPTDSSLRALKSHSIQEFEKLKSTFLERKENNFIRDCHGDLHLGNLFLDKSISNHINIFDRIEFNLNFRFIDVINDIAFLIMDLKSINKDRLAFRFLNTYLELTGDYQGLALLNFYIIYRAMIRAKVALLSQPKKSQDVLNNEKNNTFIINIQTGLNAMNLQKNNKPILIIMHGLSGSGKTYLAKKLAPEISAIIIRSDIERKRLYLKFTQENDRGNKIPELYSDQISALTFDKLYELAESIIRNGYSVIVDATFLKVEHRSPFIELAKKLDVHLKILQCESPLEMIHQRVTERFKQNQDASDADSRIVELQRLDYEELTENEQKICISVDTTKIEDMKKIIESGIIFN